MTDLKRILILTADAGFGHRSAANAVAAALQETHGGESVVNIVNVLEDERVPGFLRNSQADYDRLVRDMPELYKFGYEAIDASVPSLMVEAALTVMLFEVMVDLIRRYKPDAILITYPLYQAPLHATRSISRLSVPLLTVITDLVSVHRLWFHEAVDWYLVPTPQVRELALGYGVPSNRIAITGIPVNPELVREQRDARTIRSALGWEPDLVTVLAVGSQRMENFDARLHGLNHSALPLQLVAVAGGNDELYERLQSTQWHVPAHVYNFADNLPTMMRAADLVVCKAGGLIVTEALACGLPLILIDVLPGQETGNAEYVVQGEAGELAKGPLDVLEVAHHWLEDDGALLARRSENASSLGRPRAAYTVAERVWAAAERGAGAREHSHIAGRPRLIELLDRNGVRWQDRLPLIRRDHRL